MQTTRLPCARPGARLALRRAARSHVVAVKAAVVVRAQPLGAEMSCSTGAQPDAALARSECTPSTSARKHPSSHRRFDAQEPGSTVLVAGSTGGVGQLVTAKLLEVRRC